MVIEDAKCSIRLVAQLYDAIVKVIKHKDENIIFHSIQ